jgi:hypothetical protein
MRRIAGEELAARIRLAPEFALAGFGGLDAAIITL